MRVRPRFQLHTPGHKRMAHLLLSSTLVLVGACSPSDTSVAPENDAGNSPALKTSEMDIVADTAQPAVVDRNDRSRLDFQVMNMRSLVASPSLKTDKADVGAGDFVRLQFTDIASLEDPGYAYIRLPIKPGTEYVWRAEVRCEGCGSSPAKLTWFDDTFHPNRFVMTEDIQTHYIDVKTDAEFVNFYFDTRNIQSTADKVDIRFALAETRK